MSISKMESLHEFKAAVKAQQEASQLEFNKKKKGVSVFCEQPPTIEIVEYKALAKAGAGAA